MLLRAPHGWSPVVVAAVAMVLLAVLDLGGAYAAKEAVGRRSPAFALAGLTLFALLFWVYCSSLQYAELAPVTFGWIVVLQIGVVLLDRFHYGVSVPRGHWVAIGLILAAQAYLLLAPSGTAPPGVAAPPGPAASVEAAASGGSVAADRVVRLPAPRDGAEGPAGRPAARHSRA